MIIKTGKGTKKMYRINNRHWLDAAILLVIPVFIALLHLFSRNMSFMFNDNLLFFANEYNIIQMMHDGIFPVRDPYLYIDLMRTGVGSPLYWPQAVYHLIGSRLFSSDVETLRIIWTCLHIIHICIPSIAMYALLRYGRLGRWAALFGGTAYGWNLYIAIMGGIYTAHQRAVHISAIPIVWLIAIYSLDRKRYYLNAVSGLLIGWAILAGGLQPVIYMVPFLFAYVFVRYVKESGLTVKNIVGGLGLLLSIMIPVILCSLPVILTASDVLPYYERARETADRLHPMFTLKDFFKGYVEPFSQWGIRGSYLPWESSRYFGLIAIPLFLIGTVCIFIKKSRKDLLMEICFLCVFIFAFAICAGYAYFPRFALKLFLFQKGFARYPFRIYPLVMFAVSYFAARGLDALSHKRPKKDKLFKWLFVFSLAAVIFLILFKLGAHRPVIGGNAFFVSGSVIAVSSAIFLLFAYLKPRINWIVTVMLILDLGLVSYVYCTNRYQAMDHFEKDWYKDCFLRTQDQDWIKKLPRTEIPYRVKIFAFGEGRRGVSGRTVGYIYNRIREPFGYMGSIGIARLLDLFDVVHGYHPIFNILGVKFFYVDKYQYQGSVAGGSAKEGVLIHNDYALPLIFARTAAKIIDSDDELLAALHKGTDDTRQFVYFSREDLKKDAALIDKFVLNAGNYNEPGVKVSSVDYGPDKVSFLILNERDEIIVLSEPWMPPWKASIDGRPVRIYQAYGIIQAILVPAGMHSIRFEYTFPRYLIYISFAGQLAVLLFVAFFMLKKRKNNFRPNRSC